MKTQKLFFLCLILALLASLLCLPVAAAGISDWDALSAALERGGEVQLSADVTAPAERDRILEVPAGVTASLDLNGFTLDGGTPGAEDCVILVRGSFTLTDSSAGGAGRITGTRDAVDAIGGDFTLAGGTVDACGNIGVAVSEGGSFRMTGGAVRGSGEIGVLVTGEGSTAIVSGGEISGSVGYYEDDWFYHGTGLQVESGAVAEIAGGVISGNVFGAKAIEGTLTLSGGEVRDNCEMPLEDGDTYGGAGLYVYQGRLRMTGGTVSGNTWTGLYTDTASETEVSGGTIIGDRMFAVQIMDGEVSLTGGAVTGGGEAAVRVVNGTLGITGGEIGGSPKSGVWVQGGGVSMAGGSIADNAWFGVQIAAGSFAMSGGALSGNGYLGVYLESADAEMRMSGGTISGSSQGGVGIEDGTLALSGSPVFTDNGGVDFILAPDTPLTVAGPLALDEPLSVMVSPIRGEEVTFTAGLPGNGSAEDFVYAIPSYQIEAGEDGEAKAVFIRRFSDVTGAEWYAEAASCAAAYGFLDAHDGRFDGDQPLTTAELVAALWRFAGSPKVNTDAPWPYSDVAADAPLADAIRWLEANGAVPDTPGLAEPDKTVQRLDMLTLCLTLPQVMEHYLSAEVSGELPFADAGELDEEFSRYVLWLSESGILQGFGDGTMGLERLATRAQLATVLMRLFTLFG